MRDKHRSIEIITLSIVIWALLGAVTTLILFLILLVPLALLIKIFGG